MAFTVSDFNDLKRLLADHPDWQIELRRLLLPEDFEALPSLVRDLIEAHRRAESRLERLEQAVEKLLAAHQQAEARMNRVEARLERVEKAVAELAEAQRRAESRLEGVERRLEYVEARLERLEDRGQRMEVKLGRVDGRTLELLYHQKAPAYLGRWIRRVKIVDTNDLIERVEPHLDDSEIDDVMLTDLVLSGRASRLPNRPEVWLAVEISAVVDRQDVARAARRAGLLRRAGVPAVPVVAGESVTEGAEAEAEQRGVVMLQDGSPLFWDEAWSAWPV